MQKQQQQQQDRPMKYEFSPMEFKMRQQVKSPVAASVRKSSPRYVSVRISGEIAKKVGLKKGDFVNVFADEKGGAFLIAACERQPNASSRRVIQDGERAAAHLEIPRQGPFAKWFPGECSKGRTVVEAEHGRLVVTVPKEGGK
jgi:hypothetical protein